MSLKGGKTKNRVKNKFINFNKGRVINMKDLKLISKTGTNDFNAELNEAIKSGYIPSGELVVTTYVDRGVIWFKYSLLMKKE